MQRFKSLLQLLLLIMILFSCIITQASTKVLHQDNSEIETIIKNYILNNPEIIIEGLQKYEEKQYNSMNIRIENTIGNFETEIENFIEHSTKIGNAKCKNQIIIFFDYECPYCIQITNKLKNYIANNNDISLNFFYYPVLNQNSFKLVKIMLYINQHHSIYNVSVHQILASKQQYKAKLTAVEKLIGEKVELSDIDLDLEQHLSLCRKMRLDGVPLILVNGKLINSIDLEVIKKHLK